MFKNIKIDKAGILKALSMQVQIICFIAVAISLGYIFLNINKVSASLPGAETDAIKKTADSTVVESQKFSENIPAITTNEYRSGVEITSKANYVKIERLLIDGNILEGSANNQESILSSGFWRYPDTKKPSEDGSVVVFGHRRANLPPAKNTFYNLDKVKLGDLIEAGYEGKIYYYKVIVTKVVEPNDWNAIKSESFKSIKLITCTPLGTSNQRLVITAEQI
ncbi:MAG: sortase [bacterium]